MEKEGIDVVLGLEDLVVRTTSSGIPVAFYITCHPLARRGPARARASSVKGEAAEVDSLRAGQLSNSPFCASGATTQHHLPPLQQRNQYDMCAHVLRRAPCNHRFQGIRRDAARRRDIINAP